MLYKVFSKIEPAIAKRFRLLASLAAKMQSVEFDKGEHIIQTGQKIDKIYLIYSGQVKINAEIKDKEFNVPAMQQSGEVVGYWHFMSRKFKRSVRFTAQPHTETVKVFELSLKDVDTSLDEINFNQLASFAFYVRLLMSQSVCDFK